MRLRNIPGSREFISENEFVVHSPEEYKGKWSSEVFENENPLQIEIGMGKGKFIHELAERNPEINYLGIEKYSSVLYRAIEKRVQTELDNLFFLRFDATYLDEIFSEGEIDKIYLNFSDPWPKDRHAKRRLTSPGFLDLYKKVLKKGSEVIFKTDNRDLFDFSVDTVKKNENWEIKFLTYDLHNSKMAKDNIMTEYEEKFSAMGNAIYEISFMLQN